MGSTTLISIAGLAARLATVFSEWRRRNARCSSSHTIVVPFGERFGVPSGDTVAAKPSRCSRTTRRMSSSRRMTGSLGRRAPLLGSRALGGRMRPPTGHLGRTGGTEVKLVIGIVRPEKANDVLEALYRAEVKGISISRVQGHGGELDRVETYRGMTVKMELADKVRFEIAVSDAFVQPTIDALCEGARTGEVGDGKIFVVPLDRVVRIRTGETDDLAVTPVGS